MGWHFRRCSSQGYWVHTRNLTQHGFSLRGRRPEVACRQRLGNGCRSSCLANGRAFRSAAASPNATPSPRVACNNVTGNYRCTGIICTAAQSPLNCFIRRQCDLRGVASRSNDGLDIPRHMMEESKWTILQRGHPKPARVLGPTNRLQNHPSGCRKRMLERNQSGTGTRWNLKKLPSTSRRRKRLMPAVERALVLPLTACLH